jgi:hypothetical protein
MDMNVEKFHERLRELYLPPENQFTMIDVPEIRYAMIDGAGNPESPEFKAAAKWLYSLVHIVKPYMKERMGKNFADPPLEYQFWADDERDFIAGNKEKWHWRVMVVFTDWISQERFDDAVDAVEKKLGSPPQTLRMENITEGKSVQITHIGDYEGIKSLCENLYQDFLPKNNLVPNGYYHEIYLNDPSRTAPEKRRIVIRQPVK